MNLNQGFSSGWMFEPQWLQKNSPSVVADGMSSEVELSFRAKTVLFIEELGIELRLNRVVVSTACVLFHRFFALQSFKAHNRFIIGATALFLATKAEEELRKIKDVVNVWNKVRIRRGEKVTEAEAKDMCNKILLAERVLLQTLCFDVQIYHPYQAILELLKETKMYIPLDHRQQFRSAAFRFINDSYRGPTCLYYSPQQLATGAVYLSSVLLKIQPVNPNPRMEQDKSWYEVFEKTCAEQVIKGVCTSLLELYDVQASIAPLARPREDAQYVSKMTLSANGDNGGAGAQEVSACGHNAFFANQVQELRARLESHSALATEEPLMKKTRRDD